jgi:coenzyme PQQ biosynthesis protein PqqD
VIVRIRDRARVVRRAKTGQCLLVYPERALDLNHSAREVVELLDGARSVGQVIALLAERHPDTPLDVVRGRVEGFLAELRDRALIETLPER